MDSVILVSKSEKTAFSEEEVIKAFNEANSLEEIKEFVEKAEDRLYTSWATVDSIDKDGQKVPIEEAIKQQKILMERNAPIRAGHKDKDVGKTLAFRVLEHPITNTRGILHLNKIYDHNDLDNIMWQDVVKQGKGGSSVGGFATDKQRVSENGSMFESLKGFNWLETTLTGSPRNNFTTGHAFSQVAKSEEKMDEVKKEENEVVTETPEVSPEDRLNALEEAVSVIASKLDEVISTIAGTPEVEKEAEEEAPKEKTPEEEEVDKEETPKEEEKKEDEVAKALTNLEAQMSEVQKKLNRLKVVEVVKSSERPSQKVEVAKSSHTMTDVMKGKISLEEFNRGTQ